MDDWALTSEQEQLGKIARQIRLATDSLPTESLPEEGLPTASDISRELRLDPEKVKKRLKILLREGIVQPVSYTPKRYRFNYYQLKTLEKSSELYFLFRSEESPYCIPNP
jgi:predicted ArsR family transcriptional regulator